MGTDAITFGAGSNVLVPDPRDRGDGHGGCAGYNTGTNFWGQAIGYSSSDYFRIGYYVD